METLEKTMYHKPDLDAYVNQKLKELEHAERIEAEHEGLKNRPQLLDAFTNSCYFDHHQNHQGLLDHVAGVLQPTILISEVHESEKTMDRQLHELNNKLRTLKEQAYKFECQAKALHPPYSDARMPLVWGAMCTPLLADGMLNRPAFEAFGYSFLESACMSLLFAAALAALAHTFDRIVGIGKTLWQRRIIAGALFTLVCTAFFYLAVTRAHYLSTEAYPDTPSGANQAFSPIPLALFSILLFVIALAVARFFFPSAAERKAKREYDAIKLEERKNADEAVRVEQQMEMIKRQHEELRQTNSNVYIHGAHLEDLIVTHACAGFPKWKKVNMAYRPDRGKPLGFTNDQYPFTFQRNFKTIKHA